MRWLVRRCNIEHRVFTRRLQNVSVLSIHTNKLKSQRIACGLLNIAICLALRPLLHFFCTAWFCRLNCGYNCKVHTLYRAIFKLYFQSGKVITCSTQHLQRENVLASVYEHWLVHGCGLLLVSPFQTLLRLNEPLSMFSTSFIPALNPGSSFPSPVCFRTFLVVPLPSVLSPRFPLLSPLKSLMPVTILLFTWSHPLPLLLWLAPAVFTQSDRPLWPMILSSPDSLLSPWWRMAEAEPCLALNYCWGRSTHLGHVTWDTSPTLSPSRTLISAVFLLFLLALSFWLSVLLLFAVASWKSCPRDTVDLCHFLLQWHLLLNGCFPLAFWRMFY